MEMSGPEKSDNNENPAAAAVKPEVKPLDGGWAWMIVLGAGLAFMISVGLNKSWTLIFQVLLVRFESSNFVTAWVLSLYNGMRMFTGPLMSSLCNIYGHRKVAITGGVLISSGLVASAFAPSLTVLYFTVGFLAGAGFCMMYVASFGMIGIYFKKRRGTALAIASTLNASSGIIFIPLTATLLQNYGYGGCMLIMGSIFLHYFVAGALYRPLEDNYPKKVLQTKGPIGDPENDGNVEHMSIMDESTNNMQEEIIELSDDISTSVQNTRNTDKKGYFSQKKQQIIQLLRSIGQSFNFSLFRNTIFLSYTIAIAGYFYCFNMNNVFVSAIAEEKGFTTEKITVLLIVLSAVDVPCRAFSAVFDLPCIRRRLIPCHSLLALAIGVPLILLGFAQGPAPVYICFILYQIGQSMYQAQHMNVMAEFVESEKYTSAVGLLRLVQGVGASIAPVLSGYLRDALGTHSYSYIVAGCLHLLTTGLFVTVFYATKCRRSNHDNHHTD